MSSRGSCARLRVPDFAIPRLKLYEQTIAAIRIHARQPPNACIVAALIAIAIDARIDIPNSPVSSQDALLDAIAATVVDVDDRRVRAVGIGVPSQVDQRTGTLGRSVNIPLSSIPFRELMSERVRHPVAVDNDANVAAFAEWAV